MEAIFTATPKNVKLVFENQRDFDRYLLENDGIPLTITLKHSSKLSEKQAMYAYLYGPLLDCAVIGYTRAGYEMIDKVCALYKLKAEFGKDFVYNGKTKMHEPYLIELSGVSKARLLKFIQDSVFFLERDLQQETPDSSAWKNYQLTGRKFSSVKHKTKE